MPVYFPGSTFGGLGYGGSSYGIDPYGSGVYPRLPEPVSEGYGGYSYGLSSYGSVDITPPRVTGANSLDGFRIEVFFSESMRENSALVDPSNYSFTGVYGAPLSAVGVEVGISSETGATSVIVTHDGSTLGGQYLVEVLGPEDIAGNPLSAPTNKASFHSMGDTTTASVSLPYPDNGRTLEVDFVNSLGSPQSMLTESEFSPGVEDTNSYGISTEYPVTPVVGSATQSPTTLSRVELDVHPMTSTDYSLLLGPSLSMDYDGSLLPDDDPSISGSEIGTGESIADPSGLIMSKPDPIPDYGWSFGDVTGRVAPGTSFRADIRFNVSGATFIPAVTNGFLGVFVVSDGSIQVEISLGASLGTEILGIESGGVSLQVPAQWNTSSSHTVSLIRNQKGDFYSVVFDGTPLVTFPISSATKPATYSAGTAFVLNGGTYSVSLFRIEEVKLTSSLTLFTDAWNFIHNLSVPFTGSSALSKNKIVTKRGPLVRGWGDNTPATKQDVEVRVNGVPVVIAGVNPYIGEIYTAVPIPLAASGTFTIEVDYIWFMTPAMEMVGLNTLGLTLNTWDRSVGHTAGVPSPIPTESLGVVKTNRFPMGVALGPYKRETPKQIGHKYIGFQGNGYSALLNNPDSLLLNRNPHSIGFGKLTVEAIRSRGLFNGQTTPGDSDTPWYLEGVDSGGLVGDGTYRVVDASSGPYGIGTATIWKRTLDLSVDTQVTDIARFKVESFTADGVFTGVGFGFHDGAHLVIVGALLIDGVQHVGVLLDATKTHLKEGWQIGPSVDGEATTRTTTSIPYDGSPSGIKAGDRFRIPDGSQAGTYTIGDCGLSLSEDGLEIEITFSPALPVDPDTFGAKDVRLVFETPWDTNFVSFRVYSHFPTGSATVYIGGGISGLIADIEEVAPFPAQTALLLPATDAEQGVMFWGSISRRAESSSIWDITQYTSDPPRITNTVTGVTVSADMDVPPEDEANDPWYIVGDFGTASVDSTGSRLLLKATSGDAEIPVEFTYERIEPYLTPKVETDFETTFLVESGILGAGDAQMRVRDTSREVLLTTIHYVEDTTTNSRQLIPTRPNVSLTGLQSPEDAGWTAVFAGTAPDPFVRGQTLEISKSTTQTASWKKSAPFGASVDDEGLILEFRIRIESQWTAGSNGIGIAIGSQVSVAGSTGRVIQMTLGNGTVELRDQALNIVQSFAFQWDDGGEHTYRLLCDTTADIAVLVIDDTVIGSTAFSGFSTSVTTDYINAYLSMVGDGAFEAVLDYMSATPLRIRTRAGQTANRTLGVYLRKTPTGEDTSVDDIDSYRIPRTDGTNALNSSLFATPQPMDWTAACQVRVYCNPNWGVSVYRPDMPSPGTGDPATSTDTGDAWINVEYGDLPVHTIEEYRGTLAFGCMDPRAISQCRWSDARYSIRKANTVQTPLNQMMVLNRAHIITSGEQNIDTTPEVATIISRGPSTVYIPDSGIYADRVFTVVVEGSIIPASGYEFNSQTQELTFHTPIGEGQHAVTVTFAASKSVVTQKYLCDQPIEETVTVTNEGTPPVPTGLSNCVVSSGDSVSINTICDGPGIGQGLASIEVDGHFTTDCFPRPRVPGAATSVLILGSTRTRTNDRNVSIQRSNKHTDVDMPPHTKELFVFSSVALVEEDSFGYTPSDNTPPTYSDDSVYNPDAAPTANGNGGAAYTLSDDAVTSRLNSVTLSLLGTSMVLEGGQRLTPPVITTGYIRAAN